MQTMMPQLEVITGCMFSGKTEELIRRLERVRIANGKLLLFKPTIDDRYSTTSVVTHYGREFSAHLLSPGMETMALADRVDKLQAVCVKCGGVATRSQRLRPRRTGRWFRSADWGRTRRAAGTATRVRPSRSSRPRRS